MGQLVLRYDDSRAQGKAQLPSYIGRKKKCSYCRIRFKRGQRVQVGDHLIFCDHSGDLEDRGDCEFTYSYRYRVSISTRGALYHGPRHTTRRTKRRK